MASPVSADEESWSLCGNDVPFRLFYRILGTIGFGASSEALLAEDRLLGRRVVIKRIAATLAADPEWLARFRREMEALARLDHPNIVRLLDVHPGNGQRTDPPFYVMEYAEGESLRARLDRGVPMAPAEACRLFEPLFDALTYLHGRGVTHRDIKPSAIYVTAQGVPRLLDFGLAIEAGLDDLTQPGTLIGTPAYMSPEQFRGEAVDGRADLFSLGAVIYECLTGEKAFQGGITAVMQRILSGEGPPPPGTIAPGLPPALDAFMARILARPPQDRFPDAAAAKAAFRDALDCATAPPPA
jgi:serine/threonine-protein kinase